MKYLHTKQDKFIIENIGFESKEVSIYLAAIEIGGGTVTELARAGKIERTGIYYYIKKLLSRGLLYVAARGRRKIYLPCDPKKIQDILDQKKSQFLSILPILQEKYSREIGKSIIEYYQGKKDMIKFYERVYKILKQMREPDNIIYVFGQSYREVTNIYKSIAITTPPIDQIDIKTNAILSKSQKSKNPKENIKDPYIVSCYNLPEAERRYIDSKYAYRGAFVIAQDKIISYDDKNLFFSITENKSMADTWQMFFEFIWNHLPREKAE